MMMNMSAYIKSVICAAILSGILTGLMDKKSTNGTWVKMLGAILVIITVISPVRRLSIGSFSEYFNEIQADSGNLVSSIQMETEEEVAAIISEKTQAYIRDKATRLGLEVAVDITLTNEEHIPWKVKICGAASPYAKRSLQDLIVQDIGIPRERQIWIG